MSTPEGYFPFTQIIEALERVRLECLGAAPLYAVDASGSDDYTITPSPAIVSYTDGLLVAFRASTANTGAATLAISGLAAKPLVKSQGGLSTALATGDIRANQIVIAQYSSVADNFQMQSLLGNTPGGISGLTAGTVPKAASSSTLTNSSITIDSDGVKIGANDLLVSQSIQSGGSAGTPSIYISGNVSAAGGISFKNNQELGWSSGSAASNAVDVGMSRNAAGKLEINDTAPISASDETHLRDLFLRQIYLTQTITAGGTTGNQTINKAAGTVNIAAAGTSVVVTNSLVSTSSIVLAVIRTNDSTATIKNVVPGSGSFTINLGAAATAEVSIGFVVINK